MRKEQFILRQIQQLLGSVWEVHLVFTTRVLGVHLQGYLLTSYTEIIKQDEVVSHLDPGMVPSTGDPDAAGYAERANKAKKVVKISARSLGKLDRNEVMKTAAKARASSSVFRPIDAHRGHESDVISSGKASIRSSTSIGYSGPKESNNETRLSPLQNSYPQSLANQDDYDTGTPTASSLSCPVHIHKLAPHSQLPPTAHPPAPVRPASGIQRAPVPTTQISNPKCSIQLHLMFGTTEKPLLSGIKRLVGTCQCLLKREQDLELSCLQETHVSWRIQAVSLATT